MALARPFRWHHGRVRLRITTKLFLAVLATAALVVVAMSAAAHWSLTRSFLGYVNGLGVERLDATMPRIAAAYAENGSWDFVHEHRPGWLHLLMPRPPLIEDDEDGERAPPAAASELTGAMLRWTLLDEQHRYITGYRQNSADAVERPVVVEGRTVGYVAMAPFQSVAAAGAQRFERNELQASLAVGAIALALAALIAGWISVVLLRPVQRVALATGRLAAGEYQTRVRVDSQDEVGRLAADFNHLAHTLERNAGLRRSFFTDVSHDLRTPLAVLQGELEAIEDGVRPLTDAAVKSLLSETKSLSQLVADLHEFALAGTGSLSYRMQPTDIAAVLQDTVQAFRARLQEHRLRLDDQLPTAPLLVRGDAVRLRQVFHNLLENSVRYTHPGGVVQVRASSADGQVLVDIEDSAPGVSETELPLLFARLYRTREAGERAPGSGLGLAICRAVIEAHRGSIEAVPSALGGVRIPVRLPLLG